MFKKRVVRRVLSILLSICFSVVILPVKAEATAIEDSETAKELGEETEDGIQLVEDEIEDVEEVSMDEVIVDGSNDGLNFEKEIVHKSEKIQDGVKNNTVYGVATFKALVYCAKIPGATIHFAKNITNTGEIVEIADGVTISGKDSMTGRIYTYTYAADASATNPFQIVNSNTTVTFEDLNIVATGSNGIVYVPTDASVNTVQIFRNVNYTSKQGQPFFMPKGKVILSGNCTFVQGADGDKAQEFAEIAELEIAANSTISITHDSFGASPRQNVLWNISTNGIANFTIGENAKVNITSTKSFLYGTGTSEFIIKNGAELIINQGMTRGLNPEFNEEWVIEPIIRVEQGSTLEWNNNSARELFFNANAQIHIDGKARFTNSGSATTMRIGANGKLFVHKGGELAVINTSTGPAINTHSNSAKIFIDNAKKVEFTANVFPIQLLGRTTNTTITNQEMSMSNDGLNYKSFGIAKEMKFIFIDGKNSKVVSSNPIDWDSKNTFQQLVGSTKSIVFNELMIEIPKPISDLNTEVTVETALNQNVIFKGTYEDGTNFQLSTITTQDRKATIDLQGKRLLRNSTLEISTTKDTGEVVKKVVNVLPKRPPTITASSRVEMLMHSSEAQLLEALNNVVTVTSLNKTNVSFTITNVKLDTVGSYLAVVVATDIYGNSSHLEIPIFVYDSNCSISTFDVKQPLSGIMIYAKDFSLEALKIKGNLNQLVKTHSSYQAWDEKGVIKAEPTIDLGGLVEIPLPKDYHAIFNINGLSKSIVVNVAIDHSVINVKIPKKLLFGSLATTTDQEIYSPEYQIINNSITDINMYVSSIKETTHTGLELVVDETKFNNKANQAVLYLHSDDTHKISLVSNMQEQYFNSIGANDHISMRLKGKYDGKYNQTLLPKYKMIWRFEVK